MPGNTNKAVILARGLGTRMRRADNTVRLAPDQAAVADTGLKAMIPVGRPFLDYVLSGLAEAGYSHVCLVIGPEHHAVRQYYAQQTLRRLSVSYAIQSEPRGTADALLATEPFAGSDEFLVMNSDNYYPVPVLNTLRGLDEPGTVLFDRTSLVRNSNIPAERVRAFAYAEVKNGYLKSLVEKPDENTTVPDDALISMNIWRFSPDIFHYCRTVPQSPRGEYELPVAVSLALRSGMRLRAERSDLGVLDLSRRDDVAAVTKLLADVKVEL